MKTKRKLPWILAYIFTVSMLLAFFPTAIRPDTAPRAIPPELTAQELVSRMGVGWNLGNTFDAWGAPGARLTSNLVNVEVINGIARTPTPTLGASGRPNPQTNPIQISLMIFGAVVTLGLTTYGIISITKKQIDATKEYRTNAARYNREKRLTDMLDEEK